MDDEEIYIKLPYMFDIKQEGEYVYRLNSALYGMVHFSKLWFDMLSMGLKSYAMAPSDYDPCLFMGYHVIF